VADYSAPELAAASEVADLLQKQLPILDRI
jgi:hypothetical protein